MIMITHDLGVVAEIADDVVVMYAAKVVEQAPVDELFDAAAPSLHVGPARLAAAARRRTSSGSCRSRARRRRCSTAAAAAGSTRAARTRWTSAGRPRPSSSRRRATRRTSTRATSTTTTKEREADEAAAAMMVGPPDGATTLLVVEDVKKHFPVTRGIIFQKQIAAVKAVDGVRFTLDAGRDARASSASPAAASRRSRAASCACSTRPAGEIVFDGRDITHLSRAEMRPIRREMMMVFQDPYASLNGRKRVGFIIAEALEVHGIGISQRRISRFRTRAVSTARCSAVSASANAAVTTAMTR